MQRTQVSLTPEQYQSLAEEAQRLGVTIPAVIRRLIDEHFRQEAPDGDPLGEIVGMVEGSGETVGREHNRYLYGKESG